MRYYVTSDIHGYYTPLKAALTKAGFFEDTGPHKLVILGDLMDRGAEAVVLQQFVLELMEKKLVILIRGNHEDLYELLVGPDRGTAYQQHIANGTYDTVLQLTGFDRAAALREPAAFAKAGKQTPFYQKIMPAMRDYYETERYVFVHGWIPCIARRGSYYPIGNWRAAGANLWEQARWYNGIDAAQTSEEEKIVVCGHWHASYGHAKYERAGSEFGPDADFSPYYARRIIALDACTAYSGLVNCVVLEDKEYEKKTAASDSVSIGDKHNRLFES